MLKALEQFTIAGGVDSRSNPLNMPERTLRCLNWVPKQAGWLQLREGYTTITVNSVTASAIHTLIPYTLWNGTKYLIRFQGTTPYQVAIADGTVTNPTVKGAAFASATRGFFYAYNNHIYYGNGTDQKWFDGTTWRDNGIAQLAQSKANQFQVGIFDQEMTAAQIAAATLAQAGGGNFQPTVLNGIQWYVVLFDNQTNNMNAAINAFPRQTVSSANQQFQFSGLPNTTSSHEVKLFAYAGDGQGSAFLCTTAAATNITGITRSGLTISVNAIAHGRSTNDAVIISGTSEPIYNQVWVITVVDANNFTISCQTSQGAASAFGGTVQVLAQCPAATTSFNITATTQATSIIANDVNRGVNPSTIGGSTPGYQFYASLYNVNNGQHVGNRIPIGQRVAPSAGGKWLLFFYNIPAITDSELVYLIGRTGDGAQIPYVCTDTNGNWLTVPGTLEGGQACIGAFGTIDGNFELPFRNNVIPSTCDKFAVVDDYVYAADSVSPTIRRCGSFLKSRSGTFTGDPAQSWAPNDIQTFPTNQPVTCLAENDSMLFAGTLSDCALLVDMLGVPMWMGPWKLGVAGSRARIKTPYGLFWVTNDKELATFVNGTPTVVSDEYNAGELAQIGDAFISQVEMTYYRDSLNDKDEISIHCQKTSGAPHVIVIDFKLRDDRSPYGQAYSKEFQGPLSTTYTAFTSGIQIVDSTSHRRIWAGASNGQIYQMYSGSNDAGTEFSADALALVNLGPDRPQIPYIDFYGDSNLLISVGKQLNSTVDANQSTDLTPLTTDTGTAQAVDGWQDSFVYRYPINDPEFLKVYIRLQLTSHSTDGSLALSNPIHCPLEPYGRVWEVIPSFGEPRGRI